MTANNDSGELDAEDRNALSDREYAFPDKRKEPIHDAAHVRNAISRFNQVTEVTDEERREAFERIQRAAKRFDVEMSASSWKELARPEKGSNEGRGNGEKTKDELYAEAARRNIKGRSSMTKAQLENALHS